jgi:hypothetical protein
MRFRSRATFRTAWAAAATIALILTPGHARADLLLDTGTATSGSTERDPGADGIGQGVSVATTTNLSQLAMFLASPSGGNIKYMIWDATNSTLLLSDIVTLTASATPAWILSDPLSFTLASAATYYIGAIQDSNTDLAAPFFFPPVSVTENGLATLDTGNANYDDFLTPVFSSLAGAGFPLRLYGAQGIISAVPEPSLSFVLTCGLVAIALAKRAKR